MVLASALFANLFFLFLLCVFTNIFGHLFLHGGRVCVGGVGGWYRSCAECSRIREVGVGGLWSSPHFHILSHIRFPPRQIRSRIPTALQRRLRTAGLSFGSAGGGRGGGLEIQKEFISKC